MLLDTNCPCDTQYGDAPILNVMQVLALNVVSAGTAVAAARSFDLGWGVSLLAGSFGGALLTFGVLAVLLLLAPATAARRPGDPEAAARKAAMLSAWEADLQAELAPTALEAWETCRRRTGRRPAAPQSHAA